MGVRRSVTALAVAALVAGGCGGGSSPTTPAPTPTPAPTATIVVLDSTNFDAVVLRATKPVLVEFHSPT
jgi:hypothetical protein